MDTFIFNLSFLFNLVPRHQEGIVWASWTIGVEMLFYIAFLPIYRAKVWFQIAVGLVALVVFTEIDGYSTQYFYWSAIGYFPLFIIGMLAFEAYSYLLLMRSSKRIGIGRVLIAIGIVVLFACMSSDGAAKNINLREPIGIGYGALLIGCVLSSPMILKAKFLTFFGRISYSLYLVHAPIIYALSPLFLQVTIALPVSVSYLACAIITFAIAVPCALICHITVEKPSIQLGQRLLRRLGDKPIYFY